MDYQYKIEEIEDDIEELKQELRELKTSLNHQQNITKIERNNFDRTYGNFSKKLGSSVAQVVFDNKKNMRNIAYSLLSSYVTSSFRKNHLFKTDI